MSQQEISPCLVNSTIKYNYSCRWACRQQSLEIRWLCTILWHEKRNVEKLYLGCAKSSCLLKVMVLPWAELILKAYTDLIIRVHLRQGRKILSGEKIEENVISLPQDLLVSTTKNSQIFYLNTQDIRLPCYVPGCQLHCSSEQVSESNRAIDSY